MPVPEGSACKRRGCDAKYDPEQGRDQEQCVHHPGQPLFHEGSKGWTCCKRRVLEFDEFMKIQGCKTKERHAFVGSGKKTEESLEVVKSVTCDHSLIIRFWPNRALRSDFYQTPTSVMASLYLKKIDKECSKITFASSTTIDLDLRTSDNKRYNRELPLFASIDTEKSSYKILGTKLEFNLVKMDGSSWPVLRSDEPLTGEIIQMGRAGRA